MARKISGPESTRRRLKTDRHQAAEPRRPGRPRTLRTTLGVPMDRAWFAERLDVIATIAAAAGRLADQYAGQASNIDELRRARALTTMLEASAAMADTFRGAP